MFNSQKINNDPEPYIIDFGLALGTVRSSEDSGSHWDSHDTYYEPRPEYDNNPNPILVEFREAEAPDKVTRWLDLLDGAEEWPPEHINHARAVLTRLERIYRVEES